MQLTLPPALARILADTDALPQVYLVGGCVRDALLGIPQKDFDLEVFGTSYEQLVAALSPHGRTDLVGRSFGVVKLTVPGGETFDFTLPRRDSKTARGHKGFTIEFDPAITPREAAARRDFTVNALMYEPRSGQVLDFFGGQKDLRNGVLRHTSSAFTEDPLRVLRGMQFAARFRLQAAPETVELCRSIQSTYAELAVERVREEWFKWAEKSAVPSLGLRFLVATGWVEHFPEIQALIGTPQDPVWHPEGDVFTHTCHCCDALATLPGWQQADAESRLAYMLGILTHDFGKPSCTRREMRDGRERTISPGHEAAGVPVAEKFLQRLQTPVAIQSRVLPLVANHMVHYHAVTDRAVRRLSHRLQPETIEGLCLVMNADRMGRPPLPAVPSREVAALLQKAQELRVQQRPPTPILLGRHLLEQGIPAGQGMGKILAAAFEAQLEGHFRDLPGALLWLQDQAPSR